MMPASKMSNFTLLGDWAQLGPVGAGGMNRDVADMPEMCVVLCTENHRSRKNFELGEACRQMARIGDAMDPGRVATPHLPSAKAFQELVRKYEAGDLYDPAANRFVRGTHQPFGNKDAVLPVLHKNLIELKRRVAVITKLMNRKGYRAALTKPAIMSEDKARRAAHELAEELEHKTRQAAASKDKDKGKAMAKLQIVLRALDETADMHQLSTSQDARPNSIQLLSMRHKTNEYVNRWIAELKNWAKPMHPYSKAPGMGMPTFLPRT